jgi:hypothetical protein
MLFPLSIERPFNAGSAAPSTSTVQYTLFVPDDDVMIENIIAALTYLTQFDNWNVSDETILPLILDAMTTMLLTFAPL